MIRAVKRRHNETSIYPNTKRTVTGDATLTCNASNVIQIVLFCPLLAVAVQVVHLDILIATSSALLVRHGHGSTAGFRRFQELAETFLADLDSLLACRIGHAGHGSPEVERVCDICANAEEDDEQKVHGVAEDCKTLACRRLHGDR